MTKKRVNVTKTFLPPYKEYETYLKKIWSSGYFTNQGPVLLEFEDKVSKYLGVDNLHFVANGTLGLQISLKSLAIEGGEIITTPFSYVATTSAILWEKLKPVYVDINPEDFCIDVNKIEAAITKKTKAILAVHVFGMPCDVEKIEKIAEKYKLKVIYDAAHAFGVKYKGKSLLNNGDASICSFHSTKRFHTIEGGCVVTKDKAISDEVELIKRFGHSGDEHHRLGINAKASEFQAAMGLCNLKYFEENTIKRKKIVDLYNKLLGDKVQKLKINKYAEHNYSYYPIVLKNEKSLLLVVSRLKDKNIFPRRYFYPSLNTLPYQDNPQDCPVSEDISKKIMCLPLYEDLDEKTVQKICEIVTA